MESEWKEIATPVVRFLTMRELISRSQVQTAIPNAYILGNFERARFFEWSGWVHVG